MGCGVAREAIGFALAIGETDCERLGSGFLAQPVNALTSLAYCVIGVAVIVLSARWTRWWPRSVIYGLCLIGTGLGSVLFHGPQPAGSRFLHDIPIVLALLLMALHDLDLVSSRFRRVPLAFVVITVLVGAAAALVPDLAAIATVVIGLAVVVLEVIVYRRGLRPSSRTRQGRLLGAIVAISAVAGAAYVLGRTDGPACDPESLLQPHGAWHVISAMAFGVWWWLALAERTRSVTSAE